MAKFCKYCGKPLSEGENCSCPEAVAEAKIREAEKQAETISGSAAAMETETVKTEAAESDKPLEAASVTPQEVPEPVNPQEKAASVISQEVPAAAASQETSAQNAVPMSGQKIKDGQNETNPGVLYQDQPNPGQAYSGSPYQDQPNPGQAYSGPSYQDQPNPGQAYSGPSYQDQPNPGQAYSGPSYQGQPYQPSAFSMAAGKAFRMWQSFFKKPDTVLMEAFSDPDKKAQWFIGGVWALLFILTTQIARGAFVKNLVRQLVWNLSGTEGGNMSARGFAALFSGRAFHKLDAAMAGGVLVSVLLLILCRFLYAVIVYEMSRKQNPGKSFQAVITLFLTASIPEIPAIIITFIFSLTGALSLTLIFIGLCFIINIVTFYMATELALKEEKKSAYFAALLANAGMLLAWVILSGSFIWGLTENILKMMMS